jgi:hypothetical protein
MIPTRSPLATLPVSSERTNLEKRACLKALYKLNPIIEAQGKYDVVDEYPRAEVEDYRQALESRHREPATIVEAIFQLRQGGATGSRIRHF